MTTRNGGTPFTEEEARRATAEAKTTMAGLAAKLHRLKTHGAHTALGYATWAEYVKKEFGITYRYSKYLTDFFELLTEIKERTGIEDPQLNEKDLRGFTPDDVDAICDAQEQAEQDGDDQIEAMKQKSRQQRKARPLDGSTKASSKPTASVDTTGTETTGDPTGTETAGNDTTGTETTGDPTSDEQADDLRTSV